MGNHFFFFFFVVKQKNLPFLFEKKVKTKKKQASPFFRWVFRLSLLKEEVGGDLEYWKKYIVHFQEDFLKVYAASWKFQLENSGSNPHLQGYVNLKDRKRKSALVNILRLDSSTESMWVAPCRSKEEALKYVGKTETRVLGPFSEKEIFDPAKEMLFPTEELSWSKPLTAHMEEHNPTGREINFIVDPVGGSGNKTNNSFRLFSIFLKIFTGYLCVIFFRF